MGVLEGLEPQPVFHFFEETELENDRITKIKTAWNDNLEKLKMTFKPKIYIF